jgi:hypothetical protein
VPAYGYVSNSTATTLTEIFSDDSDDEDATEDSSDDDSPLLGSTKKRKRELVKYSATAEGIAFVTPPYFIFSRAQMFIDGWAAFRLRKKDASGNDDDDDEVDDDVDLATLYGQQVNFRTFIDSGALSEKKPGDFVAADGFTAGWQSCSSTVRLQTPQLLFRPCSSNKILCQQPYLYNTTRSIVVTYDNPKSIGLKAAYAKSAGLSGLSFWSVDGDSKDVSLLKAARKGLGLSPTSVWCPESIRAYLDICISVSV